MSDVVLKVRTHEGRDSTCVPGRDIGGILREAASRLKEAGIETSRLDARCLMGHVLGRDPAELAGRLDDRLEDDVVRRFHGLLARRLDREPVSRIVGSREFWSLSFELTDAVLDPRADSEAVVDAVLSEVGDRNAGLSLLDLGTGSGCLLAALLSELPRAVGVGLDIDPEALRVARRNLTKTDLQERARFVCGDWTEALSGAFDVVVVNPPYVPSGDAGLLAPEVSRYDPPGALFAGPEGLDAYRRLVPALPKVLRPKGFAALEIGRGQAELVIPLLTLAGFDSIARRRDLAGVDRCLVARLTS